MIEELVRNKKYLVHYTYKDKYANWSTHRFFDDYLAAQQFDNVVNKKKEFKWAIPKKVNDYRA
tara:strand:- start:413 stop:601 length:189 start_codon:yes stop_codon:yes gene_type:complete